MTSRRTENITRVDVRIPNELYDEIMAIALSHFNAKIHHRSNKPEVTPTILELIKIGIAHLDTTLPITNEAVDSNLQKQIEQLDSRLTEVENKLSETNVTAPIRKQTSPKVREQPTEYEPHEEKVLSDMELSNILNVSNLLIRDYRVKGKKPRGQALALALTEEWEIKGDGWVRKHK
ncbi:conserved hypothetical protein [Hyella patelloides LEGE 07179]|uniref:Uncharacterized protein n=1 Tax=Hyella patelloides LEGE 07179 TaxID=945734 RepID=A0A563VNR5_9CYAN|nr:hypothetical protein [Hyella patelloides]VEP13112.1 conserved hypothetical protein [Hyella patelloides LEGE 07179]